MPIIAYHGTPHAFDRFRAPSCGIHFGTWDQAAHACTLQLSRLPPETFDRLEVSPSGWKGRIMQVQLNVENLKRVKDARTPDAWAREIRKALREGHDALIYSNDFEGREACDSYVVFSPDCIDILNPYCNAERNFVAPPAGLIESTWQIDLAP